ncbi:MAG: cadmium-translocating P-type ATPase [Muribaculaceae bacterium]|nr:cadmium-translocating P-type ATPase [Muribaculaceae bacterium]
MDTRHHHHHDHQCGCCCNKNGHGHHSHDARGSVWKRFVPELISALLLILAMSVTWPDGIVRLCVYIAALLPVGVPILRSTVSEWLNRDIFNEFTLMVLASAGAFVIGEYPEAVAVLLFYSIGEKLEDVVSGDVKGEIRNLLREMPRKVTVVTDGIRKEIAPQSVSPGMTMAVKPGESVPLDGIMLSADGADLNTAAITGESMPRFHACGDNVMSGTIPVDREILVEATHEWNDSSMTRIMKMIEDASSHRAPSESRLRRITRWYTPLVFTAALLLFAVPWVIGMCSGSFSFEWTVWLRRSLVFLVCSCPCALVVSIPLTYFASIGISSRQGILFKGHDSLDAIGNTRTVLFDKTGTVTTGEFRIESVVSTGSLDQNRLLSIAASAETGSSHPIARALIREAEKKNLTLPVISGAITVPHGIKGNMEGREVIIGSPGIMRTEGVIFPENIDGQTCVLIAIDRKPEGVIILADTVKTGAEEAVSSLHRLGVRKVGILSGDSEASVGKAAAESGIDFYKSSLLPDEKRDIVSQYAKEDKNVLFAGDGVNDAPALAAAGIGVAMGDIGTSVAIESAQVVIAGGDLRKIPQAMCVSRRVRSVIIENVTFAFGVKTIVMTLGAFGIASLWAAVFADTGVTAITVLWTLYRLKIWQLRSLKKN